MVRGVANKERVWLIGIVVRGVANRREGKGVANSNSGKGCG